VADGATIGRAWSNALQLMDEQASRTHARFAHSPKGFQIEDLGSRNGVIVNGQRVPRALLKPGDEIQLGDSLLVYEPDFDLKVDSASDATVVMYPPDPRATSSVVRKTLDAAHPEALAEPAEETLDALKAAHRRLKAVYEISRAVGSAMEMRELLDAILKAVLSALGRGAAMILLHGVDSDTLEPVAALAIGEKKEMPVSKTVFGMVTKGLKGILSSDAIKDPRFAKSHSITLHGIRSVLCAPLTARGRAIGVLLVQSTESVAAFGEEDLKLLVAVGAQAGLAIENARTLIGLRRDNANLRAIVRGGLEIVGDSPPLHAALRMAEKIAPSAATALLQGETGTGKELFAAFIHQRSPRREMPLVCVNCSAIPETLLESELFGHEKGAFTGAEKAKAGIFETAHGGTLFLDEIGEVPAPVQAKLLRAIEQKTFYRVGAVKPTSVDVRLVCATSRDLQADVHEKKFREDLYYRISVLPIVLPPLRERKEDIPLLARHFLKRYATKFSKPAQDIDRQAMNVLTGYAWPGNVRELQNVIERAVILCDGQRIETGHLPQGIGGVSEAGARPAAPKTVEEKDLPLAQKVAELEKACIEKALREARGRKSEAVRLLRISRPTLDKKIKEFSLDI
jgi:Nif-specific regulatory protein